MLKKGTSHHHQREVLSLNLGILKRPFISLNPLSRESVLSITTNNADKYLNAVHIISYKNTVVWCSYIISFVA